MLQFNALPVHALSFDLWNTLIVSNPNFKTAQSTLFGDFLGVSVAELSPVLHYLDKELDKKAEKTGLQTNFEERIELLAAKMAIALPTSSAASLAEQQAELFMEHLPALSEPDTARLLETLRESGLRLFLVSNTGFIAGKVLLRAMGALGIGKVWETCLFSDEVGYSKPDKRIFEPLWEQQGVAPATILHIGDNFITDYYGARKNGLLSCLYTKNLRTFDPKLDTLGSLWDLLKFIV